MSKFQAFFKQNVEAVENQPLHLKRFGEPLMIRAVSAKENGQIQERCFKNVKGRNGKPEKVFEVSRYNKEFSIAAIAEPNLHDKELQESWGVLGADALFDAMFNAGEANAILEKATEISGVNNSISEDIEEAKN